MPRLLLLFSAVPHSLTVMISSGRKVSFFLIGLGILCAETLYKSLSIIRASRGAVHVKADRYTHPLYPYGSTYFYMLSANIHLFTLTA
ncbi:hypothetical protein B0T19DRAFT_6929 [Cercophora scortea]|uniref:Uncharacterized protein n=1 Tax=Cercophora scortea TaxID=314031 RepID=A0AAE0J1W7_9PEZI|nr:hypothetical protein B0T19DRAFT_6929 [Cercophora scortea]